MTAHSLDTLEERIQKPGYLLFLVVILLLLIVGFVDLIDYEAEFPDLFGRYTTSYFIIMVGYGLFMLAWATLLLNPNDDHLLTRALEVVQMRPLLAIGVLVVMGSGLLVMINAGNTIEGAMMTLPAFQIIVLALTLLSAGFILLYKWNDASRPQKWRKIVLGLIGVALVVEVLMQIVAFLGVYPKDLATTASFDHYTPYSRIYSTDEGFGHGLTNNYGRYAPDFQLLPGSYRIAILGDSFVEGLQVSREQNFGVLIDKHLAADNAQAEPIEVLPLGHPDLGPGIYLSAWLMSVMIEALEPDEAIIFFDLGSDFQTVARAGTGYPYFVYEGQGRAQIDTSRYYLDVHEAEHYVFRGYKNFQPILILRSNLLAPRLIWDNVLENHGIRNQGASQEVQPVDYEIDLANGFVFNEQTNKSSMRIASAQINMAHEQLAAAGIGVKLVTNPAFTEAFFEQVRWNTSFGSSDLLLPESLLRDAAAQYGIPFLGLGAYMQALGLSPAEVQALYFDEGRGHFTPQGHELAAEAIYQCFYAQTLTPEYGCDYDNP